MRILVLFSFLFLGGCALLEEPEMDRFVPDMKRNPVTITVKIEKDFSRFGDDVGAYAFCIEDHCSLTLPETEYLNDPYILCTWGSMLRFAVYGGTSKGKKISACDYRFSAP